ncbi:Mycolic acid cyclopropane synthetase-domain-containing protein [Cladochytrium replicatum]|nr:Mycolic acid cyclopropane synthetase-domain-containing protein [Cladochytrium replicatum]
MLGTQEQPHIPVSHQDEKSFHPKPGVASEVPASTISRLASQIAPFHSAYFFAQAVTNSLFSLLNPWDNIAYAARGAALRVLQRTRVGYLRIKVSPASEYQPFGDPNSDLTASVTILNDNFWYRLILYSATGFGESYMYNEVDVDNLAELLKLFILNREHYSEMNLLPAGLNGAVNAIVHSPIPNTIMNALSNIQAHYDLGNEMFASFLDSTMTYSCPIWDTTNPESDTLEKAQYRKIHAMISKGQVSPNDHVLEIGTGWGALSIECVKLTGCRVTTLTLSKEQKLLAEERIRAAGFEDKITVMLCDYRSLDPEVYQFDKILTVEMLEAVGPEFLPVFFETCNKLLNPQGILVLQVITMPDSRYKQYLRKTDFIQKYIFPGGHCPSVTALVDAVFKGSKGELVVDLVDNIGPHYAKALRLWREEFTENYDRVVAETGLQDIYDDVFRRKWEFYFAYCEAGFATRTLGDIQMRLVRPCNKLLLNGIPM